MSVTYSMCLSHTVCVFPTQVFFCHRKFLFVTDSLSLSQKIVVCQSAFEEARNKLKAGFQRKIAFIGFKEV